MPTRKKDKVQVVCPQCGHRQTESRLAISSNCRQCGQYLRIESEPPGAPSPRAPAKPAIEKRRITCFDCGTELEVALSAESTMCKRCSCYVDLKDYRIDSAVSKNFKTKGTFVIEPKGYVFNTETTAEHVVLKGRFLGKLDARGSLTIHSGAQIRGSFTTGNLIIPAGHHFRWPEAIRTASMDIAGELAADVVIGDTALLRSDGRYFGNAWARNFAIEEGAVVVGNLQVGNAGRRGG